VAETAEMTTLLAGEHGGLYPKTRPPGGFGAGRGPESPPPRRTPRG
jgi:hypothetical protein